MEYILNIKTKGCIFCKKTKEADDKALIIKRRKICFSMLNIYPYSTGHLMVAPNRHVARIDLLKKKELHEIIELVAESQLLLGNKLHPQGFNIGVNIGRTAGAGVVGHVHFHIVPRWNGDTNFMPVVGETKVIPQLLKETYRILKC